MGAGAINEFDPYFNYRTTKFLTSKGVTELWDWFDSGSWYPLGRIVGGTIYPGAVDQLAGTFETRFPSQQLCRLQARRTVAASLLG
eukprot:SAG31_NODE_4083_length_3604_cov_3.076462_3_plen_86_part_00